MKKLFSGQFCFVQVETGRVVEISYEEDFHLSNFFLLILYSQQS